MENQKSKKQLILSTVLLLSLVLITVGISYAFFTYIGQGSTENTITTGNLTFVYDEKNQNGNGIKLSNAFPISDDTGKSQFGSDNVFDFQVIVTTQGAPIYYEVIGEKGESSTLPENVVKTYLTTVSGTEETPVDKTLVSGTVATFEQLYISQIPEYQGDKTLYQGTVSEGQTKYIQQFRLRMWLSETATGVTNGEWDYNNKTFTIKIHVYASNEMMPEPMKPLYKDFSGANVPELVDGMIPVRYDGSKWVKADLYDKWYDYNRQEWANAVTVTETNRTQYMNAPTGTEIPMDDINTMWVWIPRYKYQLFNVGNNGVEEQEIQIKFEQSTATTGTVSCEDIDFKTNPTSEISEICVNAELGNWYTHPAFTFGDEELTGFWVGKFEVSGTTDKITIKPNITSLRNQTISAFFTAIQNMSTIYDLNGDSHMMKRMEWGAVAYLSHSRYGTCTDGKCVEVGINNNSNRITGCGATPGSTETNSCNEYNTELGVLASTTQNVYGVYDMSGGSWEYLMGNMVDENGEFYIGESGFSSIPNSKYFDTYSYSTSNIKFERGKLGDATKETKKNFMSTNGGWYSDISGFIYSSRPWFTSSGGYQLNSQAGTFIISHSAGLASSTDTTRAVFVK